MKKHPTDPQELFDFAVSCARSLNGEFGTMADNVELHSWARDYARVYGLYFPEGEAGDDQCGLWRDADEKQPKLKVWEFTLPGYDGSTSDTDHLVKWVAAYSIVGAIELMRQNGHDVFSQGIPCGPVTPNDHSVDYVVSR